jgi:hypothetical protein
MKPLIGVLLSVLSLAAADVTPLTLSPDGASYARDYVLRRAVSNKGYERSAFVTAADRILPAIMSARSIRSVITIVNLNSRRAALNVYFIRYSGEDLPLPVVGNGTMRGARLVLDPFERFDLGIDFQGGESMIEGYALLETESVYDLFGSYSTAHLRVDNNSDLQTTFPVMPSFDNRLMLPFDNTNGNYTIIAAINGTSRSTAVTVTLRDEFGNVLGTDGATFDGYKGLSVKLADLYGRTAGKRGTIEVTASGLGIGMYGIQFSGLSLAYVPAFMNAAWIQ